MHAGRTAWTAGPKWERNRPADRDGGRTDRYGNMFLVVRDVCPYGGEYQGGTVGHMGDREINQVRHIQHPERPKWGSGIGTSHNGAGTG